jgi:hypothetical protein
MAMPISKRLRIVRPDIDPTITVVEARAENPSREQNIRPKMIGNWKISLSIALLAIAIAIASAGRTESAHEATAIMESFAAKAGTAQQIAPETRDTVLRLLATPDYDCDRVKCDEQLQARNRLARERVMQAISGRSLAAGATEHPIGGPPPAR